MVFNEEDRIIAKLVKTGCTNLEIGEELGYSAESIKKRLSKIYRYLGINRRVEFVNWLGNNML